MNNVEFFNLFDGKIGNVVNEEEGVCGWDDNECVEIFEGKKYNLGNEVCSIDEFEYDEKDLVLLKGDGYRGEGCYEGIVRKDGKIYWLDIVNEYMVYELEEVG